MFLCIALALLPTLILLLLLRRMTRQQPPPWKSMLKAFLYGSLAMLLIFIVAIILVIAKTLPLQSSGYLGDVAAAFWLYAIPEECLKFFMLWLLLRRNATLCRTRLDHLAYAAMLSLGFATPENLGYLIQGSHNLLGIAFNRTLFAVPGHFCYGIIMGYCCARARFDAADRHRYALLMLAAPILLHGIFDCLVVLAKHGHAITAILYIFIFSLFLWWLACRCIARSRAADHTAPLLG